jgi:hypothetical protein
MNNSFRDSSKRREEPRRNDALERLTWRQPSRVYSLTARMPEWNFGLILPICRNMVFVSDVHVLSAAFLMGLAAAAPMGPVNILAIRRGVIGGWRHTLACGIGSVTGDRILFSMVLRGGHPFPTCPTRSSRRS